MLEKDLTFARHCGLSTLSHFKTNHMAHEAFPIKAMAEVCDFRGTAHIAYRRE